MKGKKWSVRIIYFQMNNPIGDTCCYIRKKKKTLQFSCRFLYSQLLHLTAPIEQWNVEDLIWAQFGRISVDFMQYYVLFNLEWLHISWRVQLARNTTSDFLGCVRVQPPSQPSPSRCQKENRFFLMKNLAKINSMNFIFSNNENVLSF